MLRFLTSGEVCVQVGILWLVVGRRSGAGGGRRQGSRSLERGYLCTHILWALDGSTDSSSTVTEEKVEGLTTVAERLGSWARVLEVVF